MLSKFIPFYCITPSRFFLLITSPCIQLVVYSTSLRGPSWHFFSLSLSFLGSSLATRDHWESIYFLRFISTVVHYQRALFNIGIDKSHRPHHHQPKSPYHLINLKGTRNTYNAFLSHFPYLHGISLVHYSLHSSPTLSP